MIDPQRKAHYTIQIPDSILEDSASGSSYSSVRLNHTPRKTGGRRSAKLRTTGSATATLDLNDRQDDETDIYHYEGTKSSPKNSYVLVFDQNNQTATLQHLTASYSLNLQSDPDNSSSKQLAQRHAQISEQNDVQEDEEVVDTSGSVSEGSPDMDNPFDFRHFLDGAKQSPSSPSSPPASIPKIDSIAETNTHRDRSSSNPEYKSDRSLQQKSLPRIRVERKASTRDDDSPSITSKKTLKSLSKTRRDLPTSQPIEHVTSTPRTSQPKQATSQEFDLTADADNDEEDFFASGGPGGLEIDFGAEGPPARSRARAITLPGSSRGGPISLRSAANSPSSQINTPRSRVRDVSDYEFELGVIHDDEEDADVSDEDESASVPAYKARSGRSTVEHQEIVESDGDDDEDDVDVEPMELGSPVEVGEHEDEDELEEMEFIEGDLGDLVDSRHVSVAQESESESEAE